MGGETSVESTRHLSWFIVCVGLFSAATAGSVTLLPLVCQANGVPLGLIGVIVAIPSLAQILSVLPAGTMSDRFGRRRLMVSAFVSMSVSDLMFATSVPAGLVAGATGLGLGAALFFPAMLAYSTEITVRPQTWVQAFNGSIQGFGALLGATSAGVAAGLAGYPTGFMTCLGLALAGTLTVFLLSSVPERGRLLNASVASMLPRSWDVVGRRPLLGQAMLGSLPLVIAVVVIGNTYFPLMLADDHVPVGAIGILIGLRSVMLALAGLTLPIFVPRLGLIKVMLVPQVVGSVLLVTAPLVGGMTGLTVFVVVQGLTFGVVPGVTNMMVATGTLSSERAAALASQSLTFGLAMFTFQLALAAVGVAAGTAAIFVAGSVACLVALGLFATWSRATAATSPLGM